MASGSSRRTSCKRPAGATTAPRRIRPARWAGLPRPDGCRDHPDRCSLGETARPDTAAPPEPGRAPATHRRGEPTVQGDARHRSGQRASTSAHEEGLRGKTRANVWVPFPGSHHRVLPGLDQGLLPAPSLSQELLLLPPSSSLVWLPVMYVQTSLSSYLGFEEGGGRRVWLCSEQYIRTKALRFIWYGPLPPYPPLPPLVPSPKQVDRRLAGPASGRKSLSGFLASRAVGRYRWLGLASDARRRRRSTGPGCPRRFQGPRGCWDGRRMEATPAAR